MWILTAFSGLHGNHATTSPVFFQSSAVMRTFVFYVVFIFALSKSRKNIDGFFFNQYAYVVDCRKLRRLIYFKRDVSGLVSGLHCSE